MAKSKRRTEPISAATELRIIGGRFRGRKLHYQPLRSGEELVTRPMKHRVREAIFNLVGPDAAGCHAIDLFAGTGALGLEALSRGAAHATLIEKHVPTARVIEENIESLGLEQQTTLMMTSAFLWGKRDAASAAAMVQGSGFRVQNADERAGSSPTPSSPPLPWLVFCSPPFDFFVDRREEMIDLIRNVMDAAPRESTLVVEADERFDFNLLPEAAGDQQPTSSWDVRVYAPAVVGVWRN